MSKQQLRTLFIALSIAGLFFGVLVFAVAHSSPAKTATSNTRGPIQNLRFTVYDAGIYPRQLRAMPGVVAIVLEDRTQRRPALIIERETVGGDLTVGRTSFLLPHARARAEFRFDVGRYRVLDTTNPANQAELIIEQ
jgi:hypothetical protein